MTRANVAARTANVAARTANVGGVLLVAALLVIPRVAFGHAFDPETLILRERADGRYAVIARGAASLGADAAAPTPILPEGCAIAESAPSADSQPSAAEVARGAGDRGPSPRQIDCGAAGLRGRTIGARAADPRREVLARVMFTDGTEAALVLHDAADRLALPAVAARPSAAAVARSYLALGVRHILLGLDHLAFLLGLLALVRGARSLVAAITAFTLAHSTTLALAAVGAVTIPQAPVEALIALSIVFVAREVLRAAESPLRRAPARAAFAFGLLHGLGFAGALHEAGLPDGQVPLALVTFNLGVELGQLAFVAAALALVAAARRLPRPRVATTRHAAVALGALGVAWLVERVVAFWSPAP